MAFLLAHAVEGAQVDQDVDEGVLVGDGRPLRSLGRSMPSSLARELMHSAAIRCLYTFL